MSPSSRRAWIEITCKQLNIYDVVGVALLAEGVDRNTCPLWKYTDKPRSPSSRRAWIEIPMSVHPSG